MWIVRFAGSRWPSLHELKGRKSPPKSCGSFTSFLRILEMLGLCSTCGRGNPIFSYFFRLDICDDLLICECMEWIVKWSKWPLKTSMATRSKGLSRHKVCTSGFESKTHSESVYFTEVENKHGHLKIRSSHYVFLISYLDYMHHFKRSNGQVVCNFAESGLQYSAICSSLLMFLDDADWWRIPWWPNERDARD